VKARQTLAALAVLVLGSLAAGTGSAHPLAPALLSLEAEPGGEVAVRWKVSRLRPSGTDVRPVLPAHCQTLGAPEVSVGDSDVTEAWRVDCGAQGLVGSTLGVTGLERSRTDALIHVRLDDGRSVRGLVNAEQAAFLVPERESALSVARSYLGLGVEHLLTGLDHVLFVIGLVLLVSSWRALVTTITSFTIGHSVTLSLATLGLVSVPTLWFELAIAFSILVLGAELARGDGVEGWLHRWPWAMALGFGLLHGLGFAGALSEIGLPQGEIPLALFSFNIGVELGQLLVVAPFVVGIALAGERLASATPLLVRLPAYAIGSLAAYWCIERAGLLL
jgi:hydrogenase/urease accessory protein HupE